MLIEEKRTAISPDFTIIGDPYLVDIEGKDFDQNYYESLENGTVLVTAAQNTFTLDATLTQIPQEAYDALSATIQEAYDASKAAFLDPNTPVGQYARKITGTVLKKNNSGTLVSTAVTFIVDAANGDLTWGSVGGVIASGGISLAAVGTAPFSIAGLFVGMCASAFGSFVKGSIDDWNEYKSKLAKSEVKLINESGKKQAVINFTDTNDIEAIKTALNETGYLEIEDDIDVIVTAPNNKKFELIRKQEFTDFKNQIIDRGFYNDHIPPSYRPDPTMSDIEYMYLSPLYTDNPWLETAYSNGRGYLFDFGDKNYILMESTDKLIFLTTGNDTIYGGTGNDTINGEDGNDVIYGEKDNDALFGGNGNDTLIGGAGNDYLEGNVGNDTVYGGAGNDTMYGSYGNDLIYGEDGDDIILGDNDNDTLLGGTGNDSLSGGYGDDTYIFHQGDGNDTINNWDDYTGNEEVIFEGITSDNTRFSAVNGNGIDFYVNFTDSDDVLRLLRQDTARGIVENYVFDDVTLTRADVLDRLETYGTDANDTISTSDYSEIIRGFAGDDIISALSGNDTVYGGAGNDTMYGGYGNDAYYIDNIGDIIVEYSGQGTDVVNSEISYTLGSNVENLSLIGTEDINATGNSLNNFIEGNSGSNILSGLKGDDTYLFSRGDGQDSIIDTDGFDIVSFGEGITIDDLELTESGNDIVISIKNTTDQITLKDWLLADQYKVEQITFADGSIMNQQDIESQLSINGTDGDDLLEGDSSDNKIYGHAGNDTIYGFEGNDIIEAGAGNDLITDSSGDETYLFNLGDRQDVITDLEGTDSILFGEGITQADVEFIKEADDLVVNFINSDDKITIKNWFINDANKIESLGFADGSSLTPETIESQIITIIGADIDGDIVGNANNNVIYGGSGNNTIDGGIGADSLYGGEGDDTYLIDEFDTVVEDMNEGTDTIISGHDYTLGANIENLTLVGAAVSGTGNELDNAITGNENNNEIYGLAGNDHLLGNAGDDYIEGNDGNDIIYGGDGNDILKAGLGDNQLYGEAGNDTYYIDSANNILVEAENEGYDKVYSSVSLALANNIEEIELTGSEDIDATGNYMSNTIWGNSGNNILDGAIGADTLIGGLGDDTYIVDNLSDQITELQNEGFDMVKTGFSYILGENLEKLVLTGIDNIIAAGNWLNNVLIGNSGNNTIDGSIGADTMEGYTGNDKYIVDNVGDVVVENLNEGVDEVISNIDYTLDANVENLTLVGAAISGTGNELDNIINGNSGNNILDGSIGADTVIGNAGDDIYIVDNAGDVVVENMNEGVDTVQSNIDYALGDNVENLELTGLAVYATGNDFDNEIIGNALDNVINATAGNDTINAGQGNDIISDAQGNETYIYQAGDGKDAILDQDGTDAIVFNGISKDNVVIFKDENDLIIALDDASGDILNAPDKITVKDWYLGNKIESLLFNDGIMNITNTENQALVLLDIDGDVNVFKEREGNSIIQSIEGDNKIQDFSGDDIIYGGSGNDTFQDFDGSDRYIFNIGYGQDSLYDLSNDELGQSDEVRFGSSVLQENVALFMQGNTLEISYGEGDSLTIYNQGNQNHGIERFELSNGNFLTDTDINQVIQDITAYADSNDISLNGVEDVKNNAELMNIVVNSWNAA